MVLVTFLMIDEIFLAARDISLLFSFKNNIVTPLDRAFKSNCHAFILVVISTIPSYSLVVESSRQINTSFS